MCIGVNANSISIQTESRVKRPYVRVLNAAVPVIKSEVVFCPWYCRS